MNVSQRDLYQLADRMRPLLDRWYGASAASQVKVEAHALDGSSHTGTLSWSKVSKTGASIADLPAGQLPWGRVEKDGSSIADLQTRDYDLLSNREHVLASTAGLGEDHIVSGLTAGQVLQATGAATAAFALLAHSNLTGVSADQHHAQVHSIVGSDHYATGAGLDVVGLSSTNTLGILTPSYDVSAGVSALLRSSPAGSLSLNNLDTNTIGAASTLTVQPSTHIYLDPGAGLIRLGEDTFFQSSDYASQTTGVRISAAGEGDFRYLYADEMHVKSFIADLEQALAGGQIIAKSVAMVAEAFTVPAADGTAALYVRDLPSAANMAAFQSGDVVRLRTFSRSGGSLSIADCWGVVTYYEDGNGTNFSEGLQLWVFTRSSAPNAGSMAAGTVIQPDSIVLDYGTTGNGYYEVNAIDGAYGLNSPYARIVSWTTHPATGQALRVQMGNLRGVYGYAGTEYGIAMGDPTGANVTIEATNGVRLRQSTTDMIVLDPAGNSYFAGVMTIGTSGEIRQGTGTLGSNYTGLRIWRDSNVGRIGGYASNVLQWYGDTAGNLVAGTGYVTLNASGIDVASYHDSRTSTPEPGYSDPISNPAAALTYHASDQGEAWFSAVDGWKTYSGGTALRLFGSSRHAVDSGQYASSWSHYVDAVLEMPGVTQPSGTGTWYERLWLKTPSTSLVLFNGLAQLNGNTMWHAGNDGAGTGLDADTLDTYQAASFALLSGATFTGAVSISSISASGLANRGLTVLTTGSLATSTNGDYLAIYHIADNEMAIGVGDGNNWQTLHLQAGGGAVHVGGGAGTVLRVGNTSDLYSAKIQTNGNIHAQGAVTSEMYFQMATASTPAAATGFARMWFDGTNIKVILPGGTTRTLNWT